MTEGDGRPFPPGEYPLVVVGSGPGGLQVAYWLRRFGVPYAHLSADTLPGGMFRKFPVFQRLITWTKPHAPAEPGTRPYEWYDWNSLLVDDPAHRSLVAEFMDGTSYFPARTEMESGLDAFAGRTNLPVRYECTWESTRVSDDGFVLVTSDGEYRSRVAIFAIGVSRPWKAPGLEEFPHYMEIEKPETYAGKRMFVFGKGNGAFEIADGLLPWARQIILASPRPPRISVFTHSTAAARARYLQPYEDHLLGGGTLVLDATLERVERAADGPRVLVKGTTHPGDWVFEVDEVIVATGVRAPMLDLPEHGLKTFYRGGLLPALTPFWESATIPGVYFAGGATQGAVGLKKYGIPSNSAAVHGFRYNAKVLATHLARTRFGIDLPRPQLKPGEVVDYLLSEATRAPELWNQQSYLCRVISFDRAAGILDEGILPLHHFVDASGPDAVALAIETDDQGDIHPAVYLRRGPKVDEHLLPGNPLLDFETAEHRAQLTSVLRGLLG